MRKWQPGVMELWLDPCCLSEAVAPSHGGLYIWINLNEIKFKIQLLDSHGSRTPWSHTSSGYCGEQFRYRTQKVLLDAISLDYLQDTCCFALDCRYGNDRVSVCSVSPSASSDQHRQGQKQKKSKERMKGGREGKKEKGRKGWKGGGQWTRKVVSCQPFGTKASLEALMPLSEAASFRVSVSLSPPAWIPLPAAWGKTTQPASFIWMPVMGVGPSDPFL